MNIYSKNFAVRFAVRPSQRPSRPAGLSDASSTGTLKRSSAVVEVTQLLKIKGYEFSNTGELVDAKTKAKSRFDVSGNKETNQKLYEEVDRVSGGNIIKSS